MRERANHIVRLQSSIFDDGQDLNRQETLLGPADFNIYPGLLRPSQVLSSRRRAKQTVAPTPKITGLVTESFFLSATFQTLHVDAC